MVIYSYLEVTSYANLKGTSNMNIHFETSQIGQAEAQGLISLLSSLFPTATAGPAPKGPVPQPLAILPANEEQAIFGVSVQAEPAAPNSAPAPVSIIHLTPEATRRTRRTKAEIAADEAAAAKAAQGLTTQTAPTPSTQATPADPTNASAVPNAAASGTTQSATAQPSTAPAKPVDAETLRSLLNGYIARHSMEDAISQLKAFGCNRVTEALSLEPEKLNQLAEALRG